ncbi:MAG: class I SAM-dependent methyltransferase [Patescibacteria group bacterium]
MKPEVAQDILIQTAKTYEKISQEFILSRVNIWPIFDYFKKFLKKGDKVLDAACGTGRLIDILTDYDVEYTGVDATTPHLEFLRANYAPKLGMPPELLRSSITELGMLKSGVYDIVFCIAALHHIPSEALRQRVINEFYRVLRPGGNLIMTNWNLTSHWATKKYWPEILRVFWPHKDLDHGDLLVPWKLRSGETVFRYIHCFSRHSLKKLMSSAGFKILENRFVSDSDTSNIFMGTNILTIAHK